MRNLSLLLGLAVASLAPAGCATQKESHTARTGIEQLLISSAVDKSLDQFDYTSVRGKKVFLDTKYLDCVDKNYVTGALRQRILLDRGTLLDKANGADVIVEICSGGVGTDGQELFIGIPEIPLPPPSPIAIPRLSLLTRTKMNGTAKLLIVAYDAKSRTPIAPFGTNLARSDQNNWNVLGLGPMQSGSVTREIAAVNEDIDLTLPGVVHYAAKTFSPTRMDNAARTDSKIMPVEHQAPLAPFPTRK
jgi:hypothetical protein